ncbi:MAG: SCO family protein [Pseudomonadota bacterium]
MQRIYAIAAAAAAVALIGGTWMLTASRTDALAACLSDGVLRGGDSFGGPFTLVTHRGETVNDKEVITKPSLIYFGYTFCPDVCPLDNARNAAAVDLLTEAGHDVQQIFISIDPERDTPETLAHYAELVHPDMIAMTGSEEQVKEASKAYRVAYSRGADDGDGFYLVNHSTFTYLTLPDEGVVGIFHMAGAIDTQFGELREGVTEEKVAEVTACMLDAV